MKKEIFDELVNMNVNGHTEVREDAAGHELTYLSWAWAVRMMTDAYPGWSYEIVRTEQGLPYVYDPLTGYMVTTRVTVDGETKEMWLPVLDGANRAMKAEPYVVHTKYKDVTVAAATMFDINKAIMRCLTKNLAMFGLGLYIYAGEDLPDPESAEESSEPKKEAKTEKQDAPVQKPANQITMGERKQMFAVAGEAFGDDRDSTIKQWFADLGIKSSATMTRSQYDEIMARLNQYISVMAV